MSDLTISGFVTRPELAMADLALHTASVYEIVSIDPGQAIQRRTTASSPFVQGETLVSSVKEQTRLAMRIRVKGTSQATLESRTATLLAAFDQFHYEISVTIEGTVHRWACDAADFGPVSGIDKFGIAMLQQEYGFDIPRHPVPVTGAI